MIRLMSPMMHWGGGRPWLNFLPSVLLICSLAHLSLWHHWSGFILPAWGMSLINLLCRCPLPPSNGVNTPDLVWRIIIPVFLEVRTCSAVFLWAGLAAQRTVALFNWVNVFFHWISIKSTVKALLAPVSAIQWYESIIWPRDNTSQGSAALPES